jgi:molybdopterin molybdotransferase
MRAGTGDHHDVRMRGFLQRTPVAAALNWIDEQALTLASESVSLETAVDRVLAGDLVAGIDVPAFDRSAMDGFALRAEETVGASEYQPVSLRIVGESRPGRGWVGNVGVGEAVRIMTGAPLPAGADAVVPAEFTSIGEGEVDITTSVALGKNVGRTGEDIAAGTVVLQRGRRLRPQDVAVAASLGQPTLDVVRQARVRILITGDELVSPGAARSAQQIYEANSFLLRGLVSRDGGILESVQHLPDDPHQIRDAIAADGCDILLLSGGSSVGQEDHAPRLIRELGQLPIHGLAMRPSSPAGLGRVGQALAFLLPGNPVSCLCAYEFFAGRAIRRFGGRNPDWPQRRINAKLSRKLVSEVGRTDYCRVKLISDGVEPLALSGASILSSTTRADGFVIVPEMSEGYGVGAEVEVLLYDK